MKAIEQYFPVVLFFFMLYKVVLTFESVDEIRDRSNAIKATGQNFPAVLLIMMCKVVLTFYSLNKFLKFCI